MTRAMRTLIVILAILALGVMPALAAPPDGADRGKAKATASGAYIVQMKDAPAVSYRGGVPGFKATKPAKGQKIDPNSPAVIKYTGYLTGKHNAALNAWAAAVSSTATPSPSTASRRSSRPTRPRRLRRTPT